MKKYENMDAEEFLDVASDSVFHMLENPPHKNIPKLTKEQLEEVSFESSTYESRIRFYPDENREVILTLTVKENKYD